MKSKFISKQRLAFLSAAGMSLMGASMAFGVGGTISITSSPALQLGSTGLTQGLVGTVWHVPTSGPAGSGYYGIPTPTNSSPMLSDVANVESFISNGSLSDSTTGVTTKLPPAAETFLNTATTFNYNGGEYPTSLYLGADSAGAAQVDGAPWASSIVDQMGYIKIASAGTYTFSMPVADDAGTVFVGGTGITPTGNAGTGTQIVATSYNGTSIPAADGTATVSFSSAGYYPIEVMNYQQGGGANFKFSVTAPTGGTAPTYWTTNAAATSVTPSPSLTATPVTPPQATDEWNFSKSTINGTAVSDIGTAGSAATAGTIVGTGTSVTGGTLVTTSTNSGNGMSVPGAAFTGYTGSFTIALTMTRSANDPTNSWGSMLSFGTANTPSNANIVVQAQRQDGSGFNSVTSSSLPNYGLIAANGKPLPAGQLTQEVLVYNATTNLASLYINGVLQMSETPTSALDLATMANGTSGTNGSRNGIGGLDPYNDPTTLGSYNDLSTWNSALTASQISGLFSAPVPEPSVMALFGLGAAGMLILRRRRVAAKA